VNEAEPAISPLPRESPGAALEIFSAAGLSAAAFALFLAFPLVGAIGLPLAGVAPVRLAHRRGAASALVAAALAGAVVAAVALAGGDGSAWARGVLAAVTAAVPAIFAALSRRTGGPRPPTCSSAPSAGFSSRASSSRTRPGPDGRWARRSPGSSTA
jgi:hypothetical protein